MSISGKHTFRAFNNRNYVLYFCGQSVSQIGTWMQRTAVSWVVYTLTHSPFMLGLTVFAQQFPSFLLSLAGGIVSDRYNRYKVLLITQSASLLQAVLLAALVFTNHYQVWQILTLSVVLGVVNAFDVPARQPMVHDMVNNKEDLPNAIAFNSSMNNMAMLVGPALSGIVLQKLGAGVCFTLNAFSFVAVLTSLLLMKLPPYKKPEVKKKPVHDLAEGFLYLVRTPSIGLVMLMLTLVSLLVLPYNTLLPIFAKVIFHGDAATFGFINSFIGLGAVSGTIFLASQKNGANLRRILLVSAVIFGVALICFSRISSFPVAMVFAVLCGFGRMAQTAISNTIVQVESAPQMRGRVIGYFAMSVFGMLPLGSLAVGAISQRFSAQNAMLGQGIIAIVIAAVFSRLLPGKKLNKKQNNDSMAQ